MVYLISYISLDSKKYILSVVYVTYMHNIRKFAIQLHHEFQPEWKLDDTIEFVWQLKLNCFSNEEIRKWFMKMTPKDSGIVVNYLPDEYVKEDWS